MRPSQGRVSLLLGVSLAEQGERPWHVLLRWRRDVLGVQVAQGEELASELFPPSMLTVPIRMRTYPTGLLTTNLNVCQHCQG